MPTERWASGESRRPSRALVLYRLRRLSNMSGEG